jgi:hypothetical protein
MTFRKCLLKFRDISLARCWCSLIWFLKAWRITSASWTLKKPSGNIHHCTEAIMLAAILMRKVWPGVSPLNRLNSLILLAFVPFVWLPKYKNWLQGTISWSAITGIAQYESPWLWRKKCLGHAFSDKRIGPVQDCQNSGCRHNCWWIA